MYITNVLIERFDKYLYENERSRNTREKYVRDVGAFACFLSGAAVDKGVTLAYKERIAKSLAVSSVNSIIAALNSFFKFAGHAELCIKPMRVQKRLFCDEGRELSRTEYKRLVDTARKNKNYRLSLIIETICASGIRVSELPYITVEAARSGGATVSLKAKSRRIIIVPMLAKKLVSYANRCGIKNGPIFITAGGRVINRSNVWRDMKALCRDAGVPAEKVFPHNLRHLFARTFYGIEKDIAKLADILGHSSINTTRIYIITNPKEHLRLMEKMRLLC